MTKKVYVKPEMAKVEIEVESPILAGSSNFSGVDTNGDIDNGGDFGRGDAGCARVGRRTLWDFDDAE